MTTKYVVIKWRDDTVEIISVEEWISNYMYNCWRLGFVNAVRGLDKYEYV